MNIKVPFNRPAIAPNQLKYMSEAVESGRLCGDGPFTRECETLLSKIHHGSKTLLTSSCTSALEMCALLLNLEEGDEVIVPSFTFVSTANAFVLQGARIVFCDIDIDTFNLDTELLPNLITDRTRAIVTVNYAGRKSINESVIRLCDSKNIVLIEDNAHGLFGISSTETLGTQSHLSTLSFHETKNVTCGEGGALVINDPTLVERAEIIREKGTDRSKFFRGMVDKYTWVDKGSSYLVSDVNAAMLLSQLEFRNTIQERRQRASTDYFDGLRDQFETFECVFPSVELLQNSAFHMFPILTPSLEFRDRLIRSLQILGVTASFHYIPLHSSPAGKFYGYDPLGCPNSESVSNRLVRLPLFSDITDKEVQYVIERCLEIATKK